MSGGSIRFLYDNPFGRVALHALIQPWVSRLVGRLMDTGASRALIPGFIRNNGIDMGDFVKMDYPTFNAFFTRPVKPSARPADPDPNALISPCDGRLSVYAVEDGLRLNIKGYTYSLDELTGQAGLWEDFRGGLAFVFRLSVEDYHRYCYFDGGTREPGRFIPGVLHTVRPAALERSRVFVENSREVTVLNTSGFGRAVQIEVGAMMVGRIKNHPQMTFVRGQEKGMFEFGGSTVVLILGDTAALRDDILPLLCSNQEIRVRMGEAIGRRKRQITVNS
jgi:phosphatidylserine decarboxylase